MMTSKSRIPSLDLARGLAALWMVMLHVLGNYSTPEVFDSTFGVVIQFLGGPPAAPVFMFLMGASLAFSSRATPKKGIRRGIELLLLGYLLNLVRGSLPLILGLRWGVVSLEDIQPFTPTSIFWLVDIFQFAGLALILLALVRHRFPRPAIWLSLAGVVGLVSPLLWGRMSGHAILDRLIDLLWGDKGDLVSFPVFPWLCYPLVGMAFGHWLSVSQDPSRFFLRSFKLGIISLLLGTLIILTNPKFHIGDYYHSGPGAILWIVGFVLIWIAVCHWLVTRIPKNGFFRLLSTWSVHIKDFYVIHWILIGWCALIVGYRTQDLALTVLLMILVAGLTHLVIRSWRSEAF